MLSTGPILERGVTGMHSSVATPMRHGNLLVADDAAHIVPPTGAGFRDDVRPGADRARMTGGRRIRVVAIRRAENLV